MRGKTARKAVLGFRPQGGTSPPECVSHRIWGGNQSKGVYCDSSLRLPFGPKRSILAGLFKFLAVGCGLNEMSPLANRVVDFSDITTLYKNRLAPPRPQGFGWG